MNLRAESFRNCQSGRKARTLPSEAPDETFQNENTVHDGRGKESSTQHPLSPWAGRFWRRSVFHGSPEPGSSVSVPDGLSPWAVGATLQPRVAPDR